jgi:hypothetical protein
MADQRDDLASFDSQVDVPDRRELSPRRVEADRQIFDLQIMRRVDV